MTRRYRFEMTGKMPLLMHYDNVDHADAMKAWRTDPKNSGRSIAGDDRSPAHTWIGCLYHDGERVVIPAENIMKGLMEGGASVRTGKGQATYKSQTQSGMVCEATEYPLLVGGKEVPVKDLLQVLDADREQRFSEHKKYVAKLGFDLMVKRATVGASKHVRVRPRFNPGWAVVGNVLVWDDMLTVDVLRTIFGVSGNSKGLGDWRPSSPKKPGPYGTFEAKLSEVK